LCYLSDIFPTIASQAEINIPESVQGISLTEGFKNSNAPLRPSLYFVYKHFQRGVKKDGFKLIEYNVDGVRHTQLFDLKKDPWEMVNHADNPAYQTIKKDLKQELLTLKVKYNDNFSTFWKGYDS
jgi:arylsulfatase A-like enzyme